jgi:cytochrome c oxidase subunit 2
MMEKLLNLPPVMSVHGRDVDTLMSYVHWLMLALFVGWLAYFIYVLWRFRASRNHRADHIGVTGHASTWLEVAVAGVEGVLLIGFAVPLWGKMVTGFPSVEQSTVVRCVAEQFGWNFIYAGPDGKFGRQDFTFVTAENPFGFDPSDPATQDNVAVLNEMYAPVDKPVILHVSSKDVIHSFKVVPLRVCQDCIPGLSIPTHFTPTAQGRYQVICAQLCGNGHAAMASGRVNIVTQEAFDEWIKSKAGSASAAGFE